MSFLLHIRHFSELLSHRRVSQRVWGLPNMQFSDLEGLQAIDHALSTVATPAELPVSTDELAYAFFSTHDSCLACILSCMYSTLPCLLCMHFNIHVYCTRIFHKCVVHAYSTPLRSSIHWYLTLSGALKWRCELGRSVTVRLVVQLWF
jgi:hypothetical protein